VADKMEGTMGNSIFDIIGPIMAGPSSSHTAGAAKIGNIARRFVKGDIQSVVFYLHGSFAKTYKGHGSDKALLGGVLGMEPSSSDLKYAFERADEAGLVYRFEEVDLGEVHPNSVKIVLVSNQGKQTVICGASIGGGAVRITEINGITMNLSGLYPTLVTHHIDKRGTLSLISRHLAEHGVNIATVSLYRSQKGRDAYMIIEADERFEESVAETLKHSIDHLIDVFIID